MPKETSNTKCANCGLPRAEHFHVIGRSPEGVRDTCIRGLGKFTPSRPTEMPPAREQLMEALTMVARLAGAIDVSTIRSTKRATLLWSTAAQDADALLQKHKMGRDHHYHRTTP